MKIAISVETTADLSKEILNEFDIHAIPLTVLLGEQVFVDGDIDGATIFEFVEENGILPKTSAVNEAQFKDYFEGLLKDYNYVIHLSISSEMSATYQNAKNVAETLENVYVIDSRNLSTGIGLLALAARDLANKGVQPLDIVDQIKERIPDVQASFVIDKLDYLYKGGRCTSVQKFGATILRLKPEIVVKNGTMSAETNFRGKNSVVISQYCDDILKKFDNPDLTRAFVTYSSASIEMIDAAVNALQAAGFQKIYCTTAGATVSSHCGPKTLGILYINDGDKI